MNGDEKQKVLNLREKIVAHFTRSDWEEVGFLTGFSELITRHPRLLRSLSFGDEDYNGNVLVVLAQIAEKDPRLLTEIETYLQKKYPSGDDDHFVSAKPSERKLTFAPHVFQLPTDLTVETDLVSIMMPFGSAFAPTHDAIKSACNDASLRCVRADDIWDDATIIQDIFNLIVKARIVIVDFTGKNPNVMYETGIAHTLGKLVIPISQSLDDVPFDIRHHRVLKYLPNAEGYGDLRKELAAKLNRLDR